MSPLWLAGPAPALATLDPILEAIRRHVFAADRLHVDDTTVPVLAKLKTVTGRLWAELAKGSGRRSLLCWDGQRRVTSVMTSLGAVLLLPQPGRQISARVSLNGLESCRPMCSLGFLNSARPGIAPGMKSSPRPKMTRKSRRTNSRNSAAPLARGRQGRRHSGLFTYQTPEDHTEQVRALTAFLINRRATVHRFYSGVSYPFQAQLELGFIQGFRPHRDMSGYRAQDWDLRIADLHYRDVLEWAVGRNAAAGWEANEDENGPVTRVWTDPLPAAEVERVAPNEDAELKAHVTFGMEALAQAAHAGGAALIQALDELPKLYGLWINAERHKLLALPQRRRETGQRLIDEMETAKNRIADGIRLLTQNEKARAAFRFMNLAAAMAARPPQPAACCFPGTGPKAGEAKSGPEGPL